MNSTHSDKLGTEIRVGDVAAYKGQHELKVGRVRSLQSRNARSWEGMGTVPTVTIKPLGAVARTVDASSVVVLCDASVNSFGLERGELAANR